MVSHSELLFSLFHLLTKRGTRGRNVYYGVWIAFLCIINIGYHLDFYLSLIGTIDINLSAMPLPGKRSRNCSLKQISDKIPQNKRADLFKRKRIGGWWPAITTKKGKPKLTVSPSLTY